MWGAHIEMPEGGRLRGVEGTGVLAGQVVRRDEKASQWMGVL
jgi:hypothetical protein